MKENVLSSSNDKSDGRRVICRKPKMKLFDSIVLFPTDFIYPPLSLGPVDRILSFLPRDEWFLYYDFYSCTRELPPLEDMLRIDEDFSHVPRQATASLTLVKINQYLINRHCPPRRRPNSFEFAQANCEFLRPQMSLASPLLPNADWFGSAMSTLSSMTQALPTKYHGALSKIEDIVLCLTSLSGVTSYLSATTILLSYAKTHFSTSIYQTIASCFQTMETQAGDAKKESASFADSMKWLRNNWERCCQSKFFTHISKFLGLLVMGNICDAASLTFSVKGFELLSPELMSEHKNAFSVIGAIFDTVTYLVEKCHACYTTGSLKPILFDDAFGVELTDDYHRCLLWNEAHKNGNLEKIHNRQPYELLNLLYETGNRLAALSKESKGVEKSLIDRKVLEIAKMTSDFCNQLGTKLRKAPLVVQIYGPSKQGKSTLMELIISVVLAAIGVEDNPMLRGVVNPEEAFMSAWLTNMMVAIIDDFGQALPQTVKNNIGSLLIAMGNNVPFCVPKAGVDEKGKVWFEPFLIVITCNRLDLHAKSLVTCPYALQRRCHIVLDVVAKAVFQDVHDGKYIGLSSAKVAEFYNNNIPAIPDIWDITLKRAVQPKNLTSVAPYAVVEDSSGRAYVNASIFDVLKYVSDYTITHFKEQTALLERVSAKPQRCPHPGCKRLAQLCDEHSTCTVREICEHPGCSNDMPCVDHFQSACVTIEPETEHTPPIVTNQATEEFYAEERESYLRAADDTLDALPPLTSRQVSTVEEVPSPVPPVRESYADAVRKSVKASLPLGAALMGVPPPPRESYVKAVVAAVKAASPIGAALYGVPTSALDVAYEPEPKTNNTPHMGVLEKAFRSTREIVTQKIESEVFGFKAQFDSGAALISLTAARYFCSRTKWLQLVPTQWVQLPWFKNIFLLMHAEEMKRVYIRYMTGIGVLGGVSCWAIWSKLPCCLHLPCTSLLASGMCYSAAYLAQDVKNYYCEKLVNENNVTECVQKWRDEHGKNILKASAGVLAMYTIAQFYKSLQPIPSSEGEAEATAETNAAATPPTLLSSLYKKTKERFAPKSDPASTPHGNIINVTEGDIAERDASPDVWKRVEVLTKTVSADDLTVQPATLAKVVQRNSFHAILSCGDAKYFANVIFLTSNVYVLPRHYFEKSDSFEVFMYNGDPAVAGNGFRTVLSAEYAVCFDDCDLAICYSPNGGSMRNICKHLPETDLATPVPFIGSWRDSHGKIIDFTGFTEPKMVKNGNKINSDRPFFGGHYKNLSRSTFSGMCGAAIISERKGSKLLGIHVGGIEDTPVGCYLQLPKKRVLEAIAELDKRDSISVTVQAGDVPLSHGGISFWTNAPLHARSPLRYMPMTSSMQYHGSCLGRTTPRTAVAPTVISTSVAKFCDVENVWGGPKVNPHWEPYQKCLSNMCSPCNPFPPDLVMRAYRDYIKPLKAAILASPSMRAEKPLSDHININGDPDKRFIDALVLSTARGFPFSGKKKEFIVDIDDVGNREFTDEAKALIAEYEDKLDRGERGYAIAKACTKDEVLPVAKGKCRIFYSSAFVLIVVGRRYVLPVLRFLQMFPALAECAVGTNCHGLDWQTLWNFIIERGVARLHAGDFSNYDQTLPTQLPIASLEGFVELASLMDYTPRQLRIMKNLIGDLVYPMIAFNGDMISPIEGGWISGVPMTVHVNGMCGSIMQRIVFFDSYPEVDDFRSCVNLITYGDDNAGSVAEGYEKFNIKSVSEYLGRYGMRYTMPDKESELTEYLPLKEMEFLKRKSTYIPEIDRLVGSLDERSIFKSLHCQIRNKGDARLPGEKAGELIDGALREWFFHGRDVFERRRGEMQQVATEANIERFVLSLDVTFDERVLAWKQKYDPRSNVGGSAKLGKVEDCSALMDTIMSLGQDLEGLSAEEES